MTSGAGLEQTERRCHVDECEGAVEFELVPAFQDDSFGEPVLACGDSEDVLQGITSLINHNWSRINYVAVTGVSS